jgi:single-strand DNA-binding protein
MPSLNRVEIIGRLGRDPEQRNFQGGGSVVNMRVATEETWADKSGETQKRVEWISVASFVDKLNDFIMRAAQKGSLVRIEGKLETRKWQNRSGEDRYTTEVAIRPYGGSFMMLDGWREDASRGAKGGSRSGNQGWDRDDGDSGSRGRTYTHPGAKGPDLDDDIPF